MILSLNKSRCYTLMNACTFKNKPKKVQYPHGYYHAHVVIRDVIVTPNLNQTFHALKAFCIKVPHNKNPTDNLTLQFIEFTYTNDKFSPKTIGNKLLIKISTTN
jgi:hypothetical protein